MYLSFIEQTIPDHKLYLAISHRIFQDFFTQKAAQFIVDRFKLKLLVVNIQQEVIVSWID